MVRLCLCMCTTNISAHGVKPLVNPTRRADSSDYLTSEPDFTPAPRRSSWPPPSIHTCLPSTPPPQTLISSPVPLPATLVTLDSAVRNIKVKSIRIVCFPGAKVADIQEKCPQPPGLMQQCPNHHYLCQLRQRL